MMIIVMDSRALSGARISPLSGRKSARRRQQVSAPIPAPDKRPPETSACKPAGGRALLACEIPLARAAAALLWVFGAPAEAARVSASREFMVPTWRPPGSARTEHSAPRRLRKGGLGGAHRRRSQAAPTLGRPARQQCGRLGVPGAVFYGRRRAQLNRSAERGRRRLGRAAIISAPLKRPNGRHHEAITKPRGSCAPAGFQRARVGRRSARRGRPIEFAEDSRAAVGARPARPQAPRRRLINAPP